MSDANECHEEKQKREEGQGLRERVAIKQMTTFLSLNFLICEIGYNLHLIRFS